MLRVRDWKQCTVAPDMQVGKAWTWNWTSEFQCRLKHLTAWDPEQVHSLFITCSIGMQCHYTVFLLSFLT